MVVDSSALLAVLQDEPERRDFVAILSEAESRALSAPTLLETSIVTETRFGSDGLRLLDLWIAKAELEVVPFDDTQADIARHAFVRYGKGKHPAALNFGDCFSYALAKIREESLLFKGNDFSQTDIRPAIKGS